MSPLDSVVESDFSQELVKDLQLADYLSRPVIIYSQAWAENSSFNGAIDPFKNLLANTAIKNKLTGYRYFRAGLKITITVSSSPFLYSALQLAYTPLDNSGGGGSESFGFKTASGTSTLDVLAKSNLPYSGWLYPQDGKPLVLEIPFIYPIDWYVLTSANPAGFGVLRLNSAVPLRSAGAASISTCTINVIAQFVDPEVCGLTASLPQSNTMAGASKDLARAGLGTAATWAGVASKALKLVGLSNPSSVTVTQPMVNKLFSGLSNVDEPVFSEPLSMGHTTGLLSDPHNGGPDELDIRALCARPSTLGFAPWTPLSVVGDAIFRAHVTPCQCIPEALTGARGKTYDKLALTHAAYLSTFFTRWRGTMCFRFKPIVSQFHRGKLRIYYDSGSLTVSPNEAVLTSQIIDLAEVGDVVIKIPMNSSVPWLSVPPWLSGAYNGLATPTTFGFSTLTAPYNSGWFNGSIRVQVLQALTCPAALGNAAIQVECWMEDGQFADPMHWTTTGGGGLQAIDPSPWQADDEQEGLPVTLTTLIKAPKLKPLANPIDPPQSLDQNLGSGSKTVVLDSAGVKSTGRAVSMVIGEDIISMRSLAHRSSYYRPITARYDQAEAVGESGQPGVITSTIPRLPRWFGVEPKAAYAVIADRARAVTGGTVYNFNFVNESPFLRLAAMFLGYKGSIRWRFASASSSYSYYPEMLWVNRTNYPPGRLVLPPLTASSSQNAYTRLNFVADAAAGTAISNLDHIGITVDMPDYNIVKFMPVNPLLDLTSTWYNAVTDNRSGDTDNLTLATQFQMFFAKNMSAPSSAVDTYVSACPDMRFFHYRGPPILYRPWQDPSPDPTEEGLP